MNLLERLGIVKATLPAAARQPELCHCCCGARVEFEQ